ncbi:MAG: GreA/GreB family elongation factor [Phycisphaerae bacterium]
MDIRQVKEWIGTETFGKVENAWLDSLGDDTPVDDLAEVLEMLVAADQEELARTCAAMYLEENLEGMSDKKALQTLVAFWRAIPESEDLRHKVAERFKMLHSDSHEHFDAIFRAAGVESNQTPRRSLRTLETCLAIKPGDWMLNRFDDNALRVTGFNDIMEEFELENARGSTVSFEPKLLADEYDIADEDDFRVLTQHRKDALAEKLDKEPGTILRGMAMANNNEITSDDIKDTLVPKYIEPQKWSRWWSKARNALKRSDYLTIEGRNPSVITYHPHGKTLEEEFEEQMGTLRTPQDRLEMLRSYVRESKNRKNDLDPDFAAPFVEQLAETALKYRTASPVHALVASLGIDECEKMGLPEPQTTPPSPAEILAGADKPAQAIVQLEDENLWPKALDALEERDDACVHLKKLLLKTPTNLMDNLARRVRKCEDGQEAIENAVGDALLEPAKYLDFVLWLWQGPKKPVPGCPNKTELLTRILNMMQEIGREWQIDNDFRKEVFQRVRSAISAADYASYRQAVEEMSEGVAGAMRRLINRSDGLAEAVRGDMTTILREKHWQVFFERKVVEAWEDENVIWTTKAGLEAQQAEYKQLIEIDIPANAKAIGEAAAHGDLRENAEWKFAMEERGILNARARKLQDETNQARILEPADVNTARVTIGTKVTVKNETGETTDVTFLGPWDLDLENRVFSYKTGIAQDFLGKKPGETVHATIQGTEGDWTIQQIDSALG